MVAESIWVPTGPPAGSVLVRRPLTDSGTDRVLEPARDPADDPVDIRVRERRRGRPKDQTHGEGLPTLADLCAAIDVEKSERFELAPGRRSDGRLDVGVPRRLADDDRQIPPRGRIPRWRSDLHRLCRPMPRDQVDLGDEGFVGQLPHPGDPWIELTPDQMRDAAIGDREGPAGRHAWRGWLLAAGSDAYQGGAD